MDMIIRIGKGTRISFVHNGRGNYYEIQYILWLYTVTHENFSGLTKKGKNQFIKFSFIFQKYNYIIYYGLNIMHDLRC